MEKKSKILILLFLMLLVASIIFAGYRFLVLKNYAIDESQVFEEVGIEAGSTEESSVIDFATSETE